MISKDKTAENLKYLMDKNNVSAKSLAKRIYLTHCQAVYQWLRGEKMPSIDHLVDLAFIFDVPLEEIIGLDEKNEEWRGLASSRKREVRTGIYVCYIKCSYVSMYI